MLANNNMIISMIICCVIVRKITAVVSYNQPKFCPSATWNRSAITFETSRTAGRSSFAVFVNRNDTVYFTNYQGGQILQRLNNTNSSTPIIFDNLSYPASLFVTANGDIYADNGLENGRVDKRSLKSNTSARMMSVIASCYGLFVDIENNIYCSIYRHHHVVKGDSRGSSMTATIVAGKNNPGSTSNMLYNPIGIFVGLHFNLYVADYNNNRIQLFRSGQSNGTTVAGGTSSAATISLDHPSGIVLDADGYLFIVDQNHHRIVRSGPNGFRCLVGCSCTAGSTSDHLDHPVTLSFDSLGNMLVTDSKNNRIQKFFLSKNSCDETTTSEAITTSIKTYITSSAGPQTSNIKSNNTTELHGEGGTSTTASLTTTKTLFVETTETPETTTFPNSSISEIEEMTSTGVVTTTRNALLTTTNKSPSSNIFPLPCEDLTRIGTFCDVSNSKCDMLQPCENNGICQDNDTESGGFICLCPSGFSGRRCQQDNRPCKSDTCRNNGNCVDLNNNTFLCRCKEGWKGVHCEIMINYCDNVSCENNGVCRPLLRGYKCECLGDSFSGEHCEITAIKIQIYQTASKSFAYVVIIAMVSLAVFIVIMDILKYCFGIDPVHKERERRRREKRIKNRKPVIQRFVYVNAPTLSPPTRPAIPIGGDGD